MAEENDEIPGSSVSVKPTDDPETERTIRWAEEAHKLLVKALLKDIKSAPDPAISSTLYHIFLRDMTAHLVCSFAEERKWNDFLEYSRESFSHAIAEYLIRQHLPEEASHLGLSEESERTDPITRLEIESISTKIKKVVAQATLARERMEKDYKEIEHLKTETRKVLETLRAA